MDTGRPPARPAHTLLPVLQLLLPACTRVCLWGAPEAAHPSPPNPASWGQGCLFPRTGRGPQGKGANQLGSRERPGAVPSLRPLSAQAWPPLCGVLTFVLRLLLLLIHLRAVPGAHLLLQGLQLALVVLAWGQGCGSSCPGPSTAPLPGPTLCARTGAHHSQGSGQPRGGLRRQGPCFPHPVLLRGLRGRGTWGHGAGGPPHQSLLL